VATEKHHRRSFARSSAFITVQQEVSQGPSLRQPLIKALEKQLGGRVIIFFTSFRSDSSDIGDEDAEMLESILSVEHEQEKLFLVLNSAGGRALAAERIVNVCRAYSEDKFEVIVPHMAKSAATMICFGAARIHMSKTSELGPVDPQVPYHDDAGQVRWTSAEEYVRSYDKLVERASSGKAKRIEPFIQQLNRYDARFIERLISEQSLSRDISVRLLKSLMMPHKTPVQIAKAIEVFLSQQKKSSHGRMIGYEEAGACGLEISLIELHSQLWNTLWTLYARADWAVSNRCVKLMESGTSAVYS
jgi:ClpP class serine protease